MRASSGPHPCAHGARLGAEVRPGPPNPRPLGTLTPAGATAQLLFVLARQPSKFWSHQEIVRHMPVPKSLGWALRHAQILGWVERTPDHRSPRYLRYRITPGGLQAFGGGA